VFNEVLYFTAGALRNVINNLAKKLTLMKKSVRHLKKKFIRICPPGASLNLPPALTQPHAATSFLDIVAKTGRLVRDKS